MSPTEANEGWTSASASPFATTHWSVVLAAGQNDSPQAFKALEQLCRTYWYPLYAYVRKHGYKAPEAQDLTQEFFARLLRQNWVARADPAKGRFRSYLLSALTHFLLNEWRRSQAVRHGGGVAFLSLDDTAETWYALEPATDLTPEKIYERRWALCLFDRALQCLREQYTARGRAALYEALKGFLSTEANAADRARVGAQLGMTAGALATALHRFRSEYRECVRAEVAHTVSRPDQVEDELRALLAARR